MWLRVKECDWMYSKMWLTVQQYATECTALCDWITAIFAWLKQYVTECTAICEWLYSIMWLTLEHYVTEYTAISDRIYSNILMTVQQYVLTYCNKPLTVEQNVSACKIMWLNIQ